jgi:hypothetical protein
MPPVDLLSNNRLSETGQPSTDRLDWSNRSSDDHTCIAEQLADQIFDSLIDELRRDGKVQVEPPVVMPVQLFAELAIAAQRVRL